MDEFNRVPKKFTPQQAQSKAEHYCAYQERSQQEVRDKLYSWGLYEAEVENIIAYLIEENFLNEERFAQAFTSGRFNSKGWGKVKIRQHLNMKRVSEPIIRKALQSIDQDAYLEKLTETIHKKISAPVKELSMTEKAKLIRYLQSKGFENDLIYSSLND